MNEAIQEPSEPIQKDKTQTLSVPLAIIIAGGLIAGAVFFGLKDSPTPRPTAIAP